jgi:hypothetical protein
MFEGQYLEACLSLSVSPPSKLVSEIRCIFSFLPGLNVLFSNFYKRLRKDSIEKGSCICLRIKQRQAEEKAEETQLNTQKMFPEEQSSNSKST